MRRCVRACVDAYRDEVSFLSKQPLLWRAYNHHVDLLHESVTEERCATRSSGGEGGSQAGPPTDTCPS